MRLKVAYNYSKIRNRDKKLYSISGTTISTTGISYKFLQVLGSLQFIFNLVGAIICMIGDRFYYWPFTEDIEVAPGFLLFFVGTPFLLTYALLYLKVQSYSLLEFLIGYMKPKHIRDQQGKILKYGEYEQDTFVDRIL